MSTSSHGTDDVPLPGELPGAREPADALGIDALDAVRAQIARSLDEGQGAWRGRSPAARYWPLVLGILAAAGWAAFLLSHATALGASAVLAGAAAVGAIIAVMRAPAHPDSAERIARIALAGGAVALVAEIAVPFMSTPSVGGTDVQCARGIVLGAIAPALLFAWYVRAAALPARGMHVAALAAGAFLTSAASVWNECPGTQTEHVLVAHVGVPLLVAALVVVVTRPVLRGRKIAPPA